MEIRRARLGDIPQVAELGMKLLRYHEDFDPYYASNRQVKRVYGKFFRSCVYSGKKMLLVAKEDGRVIGFALGELSMRPPVFKVRKIGSLTNMFILKGHRRRGIGGIFFKDLCIWFRQKKCRYVELSVHSKNMVGKRVWKSFGFEGYLIKERMRFR